MTHGNKPGVSADHLAVPPSETLFAKFARGELNTAKVYEDDKVLAFKDINPQAPAHFLIISKELVIGNVHSAQESDVNALGRLLYVAGLVAKQEDLLDGYRLVINSGIHGQQSINCKYKPPHHSITNTKYRSPHSHDWWKTIEVASRINKTKPPRVPYIHHLKAFFLSKKMTSLPGVPNVDDLVVSLDKCFVFNRKFEGRAEEDDYLKVLGFFPNNIQMNDKMISVGVVEALAGFATTFGDDMVCDSLFTDHSKMVFFQPEPGYWMALFAKCPTTSSNPSSSPKTMTPSGPIQDYSGYSDGNMPYLILKSKLQDVYRTFKVFHGEMERIVQEKGVENLKASLNMFLENYWKNCNFNNWNLFDILGGINFMPVQTNEFLSVQSFINQATSKFCTFSKPKQKNSQLDIKPEPVDNPVIRGCLFFFDSYLLFNGLSQMEARIISQNIPSITEERMKYLNQGSSSGYFITGPEDIQSPQTRFSAPRVFLGDSFQESSLILYKVGYLRCGT